MLFPFYRGRCSCEADVRMDTVGNNDQLFSIRCWGEVSIGRDDGQNECKAKIDDPVCQKSKEEAKAVFENCFDHVFDLSVVFDKIRNVVKNWEKRKFRGWLLLD